MFTSIVSNSCYCTPPGPIISLGWISEFEPNIARALTRAKDTVFKVMRSSLFVLGGESERVATEERFLLGCIDGDTLRGIEVRVQETLGDAFSGVDPIGRGKRTTQELSAYLEERILRDRDLQRLHGGFPEKQNAFRSSFNKQLFALKEICKNRMMEIQRKNLIFLFEFAFLHKTSILSSSVHIDQTCTRIIDAIGRTFPEWIFSARQLNAVTRQRFQEIVQERSRQMEAMLQHFSFMWGQRRLSSLCTKWKEPLAGVMPQVLSLCHVEFQDIDQSDETIVSQVTQACEKVIRVFQEAEEKRSFSSVTEESIFHPEKVRWVVSEKAKAGIRFVVERYFRSGERGLLLDEVKAIFSQPGACQSLAFEEIERLVIQEVVSGKARFFSQHLPQKLEEGEPILYSTEYPLLFPDKPEHKEVFEFFCEACERDILDSFGTSITGLSSSTVHVCIVRAAHETFNEFIRVQARSKVSSR